MADLMKNERLKHFCHLFQSI